MLKGSQKIEFKDIQSTDFCFPEVETEAGRYCKEEWLRSIWTEIDHWYIEDLIYGKATWFEFSNLKITRLLFILCKSIGNSCCTRIGRDLEENEDSNGDTSRACKDWHRLIHSRC